MARAGQPATTAKSQSKITSYTTTASSSSASNNRQAKAAPPDSGNTLRGTAERRMRRPQDGASASSGREVHPCPHCDQVFDDPVALINHSETVHAAMGAGDRCPHCRATFRDPVQLVEHVQTAHESSGSSCAVA